ATAGSRRQQASGLCSPDAEGFISRFVFIRVDSWLTSCAGHRTRQHCALSVMLTVSQLSKSFAGRALFDDVSLQVNRGDRIGLVGPNGAGKSTLFALLLGDVSPDKGTIAIEKNATIGFLPQETAAAGDESVLELALAVLPSMSLFPNAPFDLLGFPIYLAR